MKDLNEIVTDFKFEIGEEVSFADRITKVKYRFNDGGNKYYIVESDFGESVVLEIYLTKIPKPKKKLYQVLVSRNDGSFFIQDTLCGSIEEAQEDYSDFKVIRLLEPAIEVDE